jgi:DNA polymerase IV
MQKYYEMAKDNWRSMGYRKAIGTLKNQSQKICSAAEARE